MDIETRLETLEKKLRLHKRLGLAAASLIAVAIAVGAAGPLPKVIEAEKFVLKDDKGTEKGLWQVTSGGSEFMMAEGENRSLFLIINKTRSGLVLFDKRSQVRLQVTLSNDGDGKGEEEPGFILLDRNGKGQVGIIARDRKTPELAFLDSSGRVRAYMGLRDGKPVIAMNDKRGNARLSMSLSKTDKPEMEFWTQYGIPFWSPPPEPKERK